MGWEVNPGGLLKVLDWLHRDYAPREIAITECGAAFPEPSLLADAELVDDRSALASWRTTSPSRPRPLTREFR